MSEKTVKELLVLIYRLRGQLPTRREREDLDREVGRVLDRDA